jgi:hypothetical protein
MPDDQFSPGSSQGPANHNFDVSTLTHDEPEPSLSPIGTPLPSEWPEPPDDSTMPDEATIILPDGAQYPDDVFGAPPAGEVPVMLPAIESEPLPLPTDQVPAGENGENGDMFSIDDLMDEPAATGDGDMFSVDELIGENTNASGEGATDSPAAIIDADSPPAYADADPPALSNADSPPALNNAGSPPPALATPEPTDTPDLLGPYGITQSQTAMPASDFAFTDPSAPTPAPEPHYDTNALQPLAEPSLADPGESTPVFDPPASSAIVNPYAETPDAQPIVNPYEQVSNEPPAVDSAMPTGMGFEPPVAADVQTPTAGTATPDAQPIVNPYEQVSNEPAAVEPAIPADLDLDYEPPAPPSDVNTENPAIVNPYATVTAAPVPVEPEPVEPAAPIVEYAPQDAASPEVDETHAQEPPTDASMPPTYGSTSYADPDEYTTPLPPTDRTVSVAPPGMDVPAPAGPIVAGSKRAVGKPSRGRKAPQRQKAAEAPNAPEASNTPEASNIPEAPATPEAAAPKPAKPPKALKAPKRPKTPKPPKAAKPPKPPKQGKSFADALLGKVEPGQRHKIFGIPVGKPAPPQAP